MSVGVSYVDDSSKEITFLNFSPREINTDFRTTYCWLAGYLNTSLTNKVTPKNGDKDFMLLAVRISTPLKEIFKEIPLIHSFYTK